MRGAQVIARVRAPAPTAQPLPITQVGWGKVNAEAGAAEPVESLAIQAVDGLADAQ
jgi:hypothetical protein